MAQVGVGPRRVEAGSGGSCTFHLGRVRASEHRREGTLMVTDDSRTSSLLLILAEQKITATRPLRSPLLGTVLSRAGRKTAFGLPGVGRSSFVDLQVQVYYA